MTIITLGIVNTLILYFLAYFLVLFVFKYVLLCVIVHSHYKKFPKWYCKKNKNKNQTNSRSYLKWANWKIIQMEYRKKSKARHVMWFQRCWIFQCSLNSMMSQWLDQIRNKRNHIRQHVLHYIIKGLGHECPISHWPYVLWEDFFTLLIIMISLSRSNTRET